MVGPIFRSVDRVVVVVAVVVVVVVVVAVVRFEFIRIATEVR